MSSVNDQLTILTASKSRVYNGSEQAQDIRQLRKEMDALRHRVVELEQGEEEHNRNYASARHMAALFEEYVSTATEEATAMLKSHETLKQQVESSEKVRNCEERIDELRMRQLRSSFDCVSSSSLNIDAIVNATINPTQF